MEALIIRKIVWSTCSAGGAQASSKVDSMQVPWHRAGLGLLSEAQLLRLHQDNMITWLLGQTCIMSGKLRQPQVSEVLPPSPPALLH